MEIDRDEINRFMGQVVDAAMRVHTIIGPGLLESAYETCLAHELSLRGMPIRTQVTLPMNYCGATIDLGYRIDILVADCVVVELKSVLKLLPVHQAQLLSYLKLSGHRAGLLLNFNVPRLKDGIKRVVNGL